MTPTGHAIRSPFNSILNAGTAFGALASAAGSQKATIEIVTVQAVSRSEASDFKGDMTRAIIVGIEGSNSRSMEVISAVPIASDTVLMRRERVASNELCSSAICFFHGRTPAGGADGVFPPVAGDAG
jgi:hypothetical protein